MGVGVHELFQSFNGLALFIFFLGLCQKIAFHASSTARNSTRLVCAFLAHSTSFFLNPPQI